YARVSSHEQNLDSQIDALKKAGCKKIITEKVSSRKEDRKELLDIFKWIRKGDVLVTTKMDRLARSIKELIQFMESFNEKDVSVVFLDQNIDTSGASGKLMFHILASFSEFERDMIRERTLAGLASARARGRKGGRRKVLSEDKVKTAFKMYDSKDYSVKEICENLGIKQRTFYNYLKDRRKLKK
ncbi:MAG: recombinase family protein, partial [Candidatus Peribacteraceae bacterium]|nr:recombinase family protein [Candidatus Peribacteraceae bacterium]